MDTTVDVPAAALPLEPVEGDPKKVRLKGIYFVPPECEAALLTFTPSGRTSGPSQLMAAEKLADLLPDQIYCIHVKTQYGGLDTHVALVTLLKYLEKKYFHKMDVEDEGNYWDTLDRAVLQERFDEYWSLIEAFKGALEKDGWEVTDEPLKLSGKIEGILKRRKGD